MTADPASRPLRQHAEALLKDITPGEWVAENMETREDGSPGCAWGVTAWRNGEGIVVILHDFVGPSDAQFIAAAPALVRQLLTQIASLEAAKLAMNEEWLAARERADEAEAKVASLEAERDEYKMVANAAEQAEMQYHKELVAAEARLRTLEQERDTLRATREAR